MNILFVGYASPHVRRPLRALLEAGHRVCMGTLRGDPMGGASHRGYTCVPLPDGLQHTKEFILKMHSIKKAFKPDILHVHYADFRVWQCSLLDVAPMVVSVWGSDMNLLVELDEQGRPTPTAFYDPCVEEGMRKAAACIVDDPAMQQKVDFVTGGTIPVTLAPLGADSLFFVDDAQGRAALRQRLNLPEGIPLFVSPRAFSDFYGHDVIVEGFAALAKRRDALLLLKTFIPSGWTPTIDKQSQAVNTGEDDAQGQYLRTVQKIATRAGVWNKVRFCGSLSLEDLRNLYGIANALINMPARDGFPVTFAEAAACGAEVVTRWHPAYAVPLVEKFFRVLPEHEPSVLARALHEVLDQPATPEKRQAMREEARIHWSHDSYCRELLRVYSEALV